MGADVIIIRDDGATLSINDDTNYQTYVAGNFSVPTRVLVGSDGYQSGSKFSGSRKGIRQLVLNVHIVAGTATSDSYTHNPTHLAARDALVEFLPSGEEITLRQTFPGSAGWWDIKCAVGQLDSIEDSPDYTCPLTAFEPDFIHTVEQTDTRTLDFANEELVFVLASDPRGNTETYPIIEITPTSPKLNRWNKARYFTVTNPTTINLVDYPVALPMDWAWHITNTRLQADARDLRVSVNGQFVDFWKGDFPNAGGKLWVKLDIDAGQTVEVVVGYQFASAPMWVVTDEGPIFHWTNSTNTIWEWRGGFMDRPGTPTGRSQQWAVHSAENRGMSPVQSHLGAPWSQVDPSAVNVAGAYIPTPGNVQGRAGLAIHHPIGFVEVVHSGHTQTDTALVKFSLRGRDPLTNAITDYWTQDTDTSGALAAYGPITTTFPSAQEAIAFALRSLSEHTLAQALGGTDVVRAEIDTPVTVVGAGSGTSNEKTIYILEFELENETTGQMILLHGIIEQIAGVWQSVNINLLEQTITMGVRNFFSAFSTNLPVRGEWLRLRPGNNTIRIRDEDVLGLDVTFYWHPRRT